MSSISERNPTRIRVNLGVHLTRTISDESWRITDPAHIHTWQVATKILKNRSFILEEDKIDISVNWLPVVDRLNEHYKVMDDIFNVKNKDRLSELLKKFPTDDVFVFFLASSSSFNDGVRNFNRFYHLIEYFYMIFFS